MGLVSCVGASQIHPAGPRSRPQAEAVYAREGQVGPSLGFQTGPGEPRDSWEVDQAERVGSCWYFLESQLEAKYRLERCGAGEGSGKRFL